MGSLKMGVVGTNFVSDMFMKGVRLVDGVEVAAVCARHKERLEKFAAKYQIPKTYTDYHDLIQPGLLDAVYLAVPNHLHYEMTCYFLAHKIPVICEKPLAANPFQVAEMARMARENGVLLQDGIAPLYVENFQVLKELLSKIGRLRRAVFVQGKYSSRYDAYLRGENPPTFRREFCNGSLMDMGVYPISVAVGLFGKPRNILSHTTKLPNGIDGMGSLIFIYDDFEVVILHSKVTNSSLLSEIQGEQGTILIDRLSRVESLYLTPINEPRQLIGEPTDEGFKYELLAFKEAISQGRVEPRLVPHSLSLAIAEVMFAIRQESEIDFPCYGEAQSLERMRLSENLLEK